LRDIRFFRFFLCRKVRCSLAFVSSNRPPHRTSAPSPYGPGPSRRVIARDLLLFQIKLWLDGLKDIVLSPLSIGAALLDVLRGAGQPSLFYRVFQWGEWFDQWLNLYHASQRAPHRTSGLVDDDGDEVTRPLEIWAQYQEEHARSE